MVVSVVMSDCSLCVFGMMMLYVLCGGCVMFFGYLKMDENVVCELLDCLLVLWVCLLGLVFVLIGDDSVMLCLLFFGEFCYLGGIICG